MGLREIRWETKMPSHTAYCDQCDFKSGTIGVEGLNTVTNEAELHHHETGHTVEVFIYQSVNEVFIFQTIKTIGGE